MPQAIAYVAQYAAQYVFTNAGSYLSYTGQYLAYYGTYAVVYAGLTVAASYAANALLAPDVPNPESMKTPRKQAIPPRSIGLGKARVSGAAMLYESADKRLHLVLAINHGRIGGITQWMLNDDYVELRGPAFPGSQYDVIPFDDDTYGSGANASLVKLQHRLGLPTETAYAEPQTELESGIWTNAHRGDGIASIYMRARAGSQEHQNSYYPNGQPQPSIIGDLRVVWDWRDPAQDRYVEATWRTSYNNVVNLRAFLCSDWGMDFDHDVSIAPNLAHWTAAADVCDEPVPLKAGGYVPRYQMGGVFFTVNDPAEILRVFTESFDGWLSPDGTGALMVYAGKYTAPTVELRTHNICGYEVQRYAEDEQAVNYLVLSFCSPDHKYTIVETDPWFDQDDIDARGEKTQPITLSWVQNNSQARRLGKRIITRQLSARGTITTNLSGIKVLGHRYIRIRYPAMTYLADRVVEVASITMDLPNMRLSIKWIAADPNVDNWNPATEEGDGPATEERAPRQPLPQPTILYMTAFDDASGPDQQGLRLRIIAGATSFDVTWAARWRVFGNVSWNESNYSDLDPGEDVELETGFVPVDAVLEGEVAYFDGAGTLSAWSDTATISTSSTSIPPSQAENLAADGADGEATITWRNPGSSNFYAARVWRAASGAGFGAAVDVSGALVSALGADMEFLDTGLATANYDYWVTAENSSGVYGTPTGPATAIVAGVPVNTVAPAITGTLYVGQVQSCTTGTWTSSPTSYAYQWKRGGVDIGGATANTYTLALADLGANITCAVVATNGTGDSAPQVSNSRTVAITPQSIMPAKVAEWWIADDASTIALSGSNVTSWTGKIAATALAQATGAVQPTYSATGWNGASPAISSDGTRYMRTASLAALFPSGTAYSEIWTLFDDQAVEGDADGTRDLFAYGGLTNGTFRASRRSSTGGISRLRTTDGTATSTYTAASMFGRHYCRSLFNTTPQMAGYLDGGALTTLTTYSSTGTSLASLFNAPNITVTGFVGACREIIILNAAPSAGELSALQAYLAARV